jgi:hypothetical protein
MADDAPAKAPTLEEVLSAGPKGLVGGDVSTELQDLGVLMLGLISKWDRWVDRRVETIRFHDVDTVRRSLSVDFTWPDIPTPFTQPDGTSPRCLVPLAVLRKRRIVNFDLRDESGRALPMVTRRSNEAIAAAMLLAAAKAWTDSATLGELPEGLIADFWAIATAPPSEAIVPWTKLGEPRSDGERLWRAAAVGSRPFRALAHDFVEAFVVSTVLSVHPDERRIIKLAYDEPTILPRVTGLRAPRRGRWEPTPTNSPVQMCTLRVRAWLEDNGQRRPLPGVQLEVKGTSWAGKTDLEGHAAHQLPAGEYELIDQPPGGFASTTPPAVRDLDLQADQDVELTYCFDAIPTASSPTLRPLSRLGKLARLAGLQAKTIEISAPALGQGRSYHIELEVPDGLKATRARLIARPAYADPSGAASVTAPADVASADAARADATEHEQGDVHGSTAHRVHLYRAGVEPDCTGVALFWLRPRPSTVVRGGAFVSALSAAMLLALIWRWQRLGVQGVGPAIGLLLAVPGGLSAYVARSQSSRFTSEITIGLRMLALTGALWGLLAGLVMLLSRSVMYDDKGVIEVGHPDWWATPALWALFVANLVVCGILTVALVRSRRANDRPARSNRVRSR